MPTHPILLRSSLRYVSASTQVGPVTLSLDGTTAYVLVGQPEPRLVALDSASGDCRWEQAAVVRDGQKTIAQIVYGGSGSMPIPVVAGSDILVTSSFPAGQLFVFHDRPAAATPGNEKLIAPMNPADTKTPKRCRAAEAPGSMEPVPADTKIPTPVAGKDVQAYYTKSAHSLVAHHLGRRRRSGVDVEGWIMRPCSIAVQQWMRWGSTG